MLSFCKALVGLPFDILSVLLCGHSCDYVPPKEPAPRVITSGATYQKCRDYYCSTHGITTDEFEAKLESDKKYRPEYIREQMATKGVCVIGGTK